MIIFRFNQAIGPKTSRALHRSTIVLVRVGLVGTKGSEENVEAQA